MELGALKFFATVAAALMGCFTTLVVLCFVVLWPYRVIVAICLLGMLLFLSFACCVVVVRGNTPVPAYPPTLKEERP